MKSSARISGWLVGGWIFAILETAAIWLRVDIAPLAWICLLWTAGAMLLFRIARNPGPKMLWLCLAAIIAAVGIAEGALWISRAQNRYVLAPGATMEGSFTRPHYFILMPSRGLGYRPRPDTSVEAIKKMRGRLVYDVRYSVGDDGLRVAPPEHDPADACVLMFGDSFAWGEGVRDDQTAAYQLGLMAGGRLKVRNFAFTGYGAHQMLWLAQTGAVWRKAGCDPARPVLAVYQTLPNNVGRVAGLRGWDDYGPRYRLLSNDRLAYAGGFDVGDAIAHDRVLLARELTRQLSRIQLYERILGRDRVPDAFDIERFSTVTRAARDRLKAHYPKLTFVVILWPDLDEMTAAPGSRAAVLADSLRRHGLDVRPAADVVPGYAANPMASHIPDDGHPTAATHHQIAAWLLAFRQHLH